MFSVAQGTAVFKLKETDIQSVKREYCLIKNTP